VLTFNFQPLTSSDPYHLQTWSHGYQQPALAEHVSYRCRMSAESNRGPSSSYSQRSAASMVTAGDSKFDSC
jgi:hypothetical protein